MKPALRRILCALLLGLCSAELEATTYTKILTHKELTSEAGTIVIGRCTDIKSEWRDRRLYTVATVTIDETLKGKDAGTVRVLIPGGTDLNRKVPVTMAVEGAPNMSINEDMLLFLGQTPVRANEYYIVGLAQGKFTIHQESPKAGAPASGVMAGKTPATTGQEVSKRVDGASLAQFRKEIMGYLSEGDAPKK